MVQAVKAKAVKDLTPIQNNMYSLKNKEVVAQEIVRLVRNDGVDYGGELVKHGFKLSETCLPSEFFYELGDGVQMEHIDDLVSSVAATLGKPKTQGKQGLR
jgi:hypothetical protein